VRRRTTKPAAAMPISGRPVGEIHSSGAVAVREGADASD